MKVAETTLADINSTLKRVNWLMIGGIIVGVLNLVIRPIGTPPTSNLQSVNLGATKDAAQLTARDYFTTADVAAKENVSERTVTEWINEGRLDPAPVKTGKSWAIAKTFRIVPQDAESCGNLPQ